MSLLDFDAELPRRIRQRGRLGHVYMVTNEAHADTVKVGFSVDIRARIVGYQVHAPAPYVCIGAYPAFQAEETAVNALLHPVKRSGEWFHDSAAVQQVVHRYFRLKWNGKEPLSHVGYSPVWVPKRKTSPVTPEAAHELLQRLCEGEPLDLMANRLDVSLDEATQLANWLSDKRERRARERKEDRARRAAWAHRRRQ